MSVLMSDVGVKVRLWRIPLFMHSAKMQVMMANGVKKLKRSSKEHRQAIAKLGKKTKEVTDMACGTKKGKKGKKGKK